MSLFLQPSELQHLLRGHGRNTSTDRTPSRVPVPATIRFAAPVAWASEKDENRQNASPCPCSFNHQSCRTSGVGIGKTREQTERRPMSLFLQPSELPHQLRGHGKTEGQTVECSPKFNRNSQL
ncbi:hypothetical protein AVEN_244237-1 [Araneus ventricosus]|uniref:Uncharacterized protein n=1 Tax=Araneus ventricosus TaxID=182803 RepID=A0A4Y2KPQ6_ARAVE|nr:hypothetical protein AVEN_244237-1 [Araneus ventricosus]